MRILLISQYFHPESFRINQLVIALRDRGHEIVVLTGQPNYPAGRFFPGHGFFGPLRAQYGSVDVLRVPLWPRGKGTRWQLSLNYLSFALFGTLIGLPRARGRFDVCLVFCPSPLTAVVPAIVHRLFRKTPVAVWLQDLWPDSVLAVTGSNSRFLTKFLSALTRWTYRHVDQVWIQSPAYAESVQMHGGRAGQIAYVPNWAEDFYDCERWADVVEEPLPKNSIVFAGNLGRAQGLETVIEAATIARDAVPALHWVFVGDGTLRDWLSAEIERRSLQGHVTLLPPRPPEAMSRILKGSAALLITLGANDVFARTIPSKVQSCLAAGRPVLGALSGEPARIVSEARCGLVCAPGDANALADTARALLALPDEQKAAFGSGGHAYYVAHFRHNILVSQIEGLLSGLTKRHDQSNREQDRQHSST